jgi:hypothetical protein
MVILGYEVLVSFKCLDLVVAGMTYFPDSGGVGVLMECFSLPTRAPIGVDKRFKVVGSEVSRRKVRKGMGCLKGRGKTQVRKNPVEHFKKRR